MARKPRQHNFTVFLLKEQIADAASALKEPDELEHFRVRKRGGPGGDLFVKPSRLAQPWWAQFLRPVLRTGGTGDPRMLDELRNASTSALLILDAAGRRFAFTFGYGRTLLRQEAYEQDFGLRVVLNAVDPERLRSVDARTFEELTVQTRTQTSRGTALPVFGLDVARDIVRAVTGEPRDTALGRRLSGADSLAIASRAIPAELPALCERLLQEHESERYKERFAWIDNLRQVKDPSVRKLLDEELLGKLRERELSDVHLAPPEPLDWEAIEGFRFSTEPHDEELHRDPDLSDYLASLDDLSVLDVARLKHDRLFVVGTEGEHVFREYSVYSALVYEGPRDDRLFALTAGNWYEIDDEYARTVGKDVESLPPLDLDLPNAEAGEREADYNTRAAAALGDDVLNCDQQLVNMGGRDRIELCDLLVRDRRFVHVKKRSSSSTLSHLWLQGTVSAELLLRSGDFRTRARELVTMLDGSFAEVIAADRARANTYEVGYAVISSSRRDTPLTLPFFSQVSLIAAARLLEDFGYRVTACKVDVA